MLITLTTDFGASSPYVAAMKGVIFSINPEASVVDLSHTIPPQDILAGAQVLGDVTPYFPAGTIHVAVIDPGVGTERKIIYAEIDDHRYVCPDNGLLARLAARSTPLKIVEITCEELYHHPVSHTFHGRDIMAPVAAHLSRGFDPDQLGPTRRRWTPLPWSGATKLANRIEGEIVFVDSFGNLVTDIDRNMLVGVPTDDSVTVRSGGHETCGIFTTYGEQPPMTLIALVGSNDQLELAIVDDSAKMMLGLEVGEKVEVSW